MTKYGAFVSVALLLTISVACAEAASTATISFTPGQEWSIKSASPTTAKVIVGRVEKWKHKTVIHVSIVDIPIPQGMPASGSVFRIGHVAFEKSALTTSLDRLIATGVLPAASFETGYQQWKSEKGDASSMSVSQTISFGLAAMNRIH